MRFKHQASSLSAGVHAVRGCWLWFEFVTVFELCQLAVSQCAQCLQCAPLFDPTKPCDWHDRLKISLARRSVASLAPLPLPPFLSRALER